MASLTSVAAEFRGLIATSIPHIIDLLQDDEPLVCAASADALSKLSEHGMEPIWSGMVSLTSIAAEFRGLIATSIPHIIDLLQDDEPNVSEASINALSKLSEHGM
jgi:HEAT repeat protein